LNLSKSNESRAKSPVFVFAKNRQKGDFVFEELILQ